MNKKRLTIALIITAVMLLSLSSCRSNGPEGTNITGLWSGLLYSAGGYMEGPLVFEFEDNGVLRMGDVYDIIIWDEALQQRFTWSLNENYLTVTGWLGMYFAEYAYELNGNALTLVLIRRNVFNETYEEMNCGDRIELTLDESNVFMDYFDGSLYPDA